MPKQKTNDRLEEIASHLDKLEAEHKAEVANWKNQKDTYQREAEDLLQKAAAEDRGHTDKIIAFESSADTAKRRAELAGEKVTALEAENIISYEDYKAFEASILEEAAAAEEALKDVMAEAEKSVYEAASAAAEVYARGNDILYRMYKQDYISGPTSKVHTTERRFKCTQEYPTIEGKYYDAPVTRENRQLRQLRSKYITTSAEALEALKLAAGENTQLNYIGILQGQQKIRRQ